MPKNVCYTYYKYCFTFIRNVYALFFKPLFDPRIFILLKQLCTDSQNSFGHSTRIFYFYKLTDKSNDKYTENSLDFILVVFYLLCNNEGKMAFKVLKLYNSSFKKYIPFDEKKNKVYSVSQTFNVGNPLGHDILLARKQSFARACW